MQSFFRRGWWKPWNWSTRTWVLAIVIAPLISPLVTRWFCLWQVPDVALPFDVNSVIRPAITADQDAFVRYLSAAQSAGRQSGGWSEVSMRHAVDHYGSDWDDRLDQWLIGNAQALAEYRAAGEMEQAGGPSLKTADFTTILTVHNDFRNLARLAATEAIRFERSGNLEAAWQMHRANLNCARHAEKPGFAICGLISIVVRSFACHGIKRWAEDPLLSADRLQQARSEVSMSFSQRTSLVDIAKAEYLTLKNTLSRHDAPNQLYPNWNVGGSSEPLLLVGKRFLLWSVGQPELTLRIARQLLVNNADQIDKPRRFRRKAVRTKEQTVFELDPNARRTWGQLDPAALNRTLEATVSKHWLKNASIYSGNYMDVSRQQDDARHAALDVALASQQYQRIHGEFPESIEQLVPKFLDSVPIDPMDAAGTPLRYRRESDGTAVVWSVGIDGIDDGGDVELKDVKDVIDKDTGYRIRLKRRPQTESP